MKTKRLFKAWITGLCLILFLTACGSGKQQGSSADTSSAKKSLSLTDVLSLYNGTPDKLLSSENLEIQLNYSKERTIGGEKYTESSVGSITFSDPGAESMTALANLKLSYGPSSADYTEFFTNGSAYSKVHDLTFSSPMGANDYVNRYLPVVLPNPENYSEFLQEDADSATILHFNSAVKAEDWIGSSKDMELASASASVTLGSGDLLTAVSYEISYRCGAAEYAVSVSAAISYENGAVLPEFNPDDAVKLTYFDAPKHLIQAAGDIFTSQSISSVISQTVTSSIHNQVNTQLKQLYICGNGENLSALANYSVTNTDYRGSSTTMIQEDRFENGIFTRTTNGGTPSTANDTPEHIRIDWEDKILNGLFALNYLSNATLTETDDFITIRFEGNEAFCNSISSSLITILPSDLDSFASSYTTNAASGYLTISKQTGLPTATGMQFARSHVIDGVSYPLTYQRDQALMLSSTDAAPAIHGTAATAAADTPSSTPPFYHVTGENGAEMWLLGAFHVGDHRTANLPEAVYSAFADSDALAMELDINGYISQMENNPERQLQLVSSLYYPESTNIASHIGNELYNIARPTVIGCGGGGVNTDYMRPVVWCSLIENYYLKQTYALNNLESMDQRLLALARQQEKQIIHIESGITQLEAMTNFSDALQTQLLDKMLKSGAVQYGRNILRMYELWCKGDEEALREALKIDTSSYSEEGMALYQEYIKATVTDPNASIVSTAKHYLESGQTIFLSVDLPHLLTAGGLVESLRAAGYTVSPVTYSTPAEKS